MGGQQLISPGICILTVRLSLIASLPNKKFSASRFLVMGPRARAPTLVEECRVYFRRRKWQDVLLVCFLACLLVLEVVQQQVVARNR